MIPQSLSLFSEDVCIFIHVTVTVYISGSLSGFSSLFKNNRSMVQLNGTFCQELVPYDFPFVVLHKMSIISSHLWCILGGSVWI